jgi:hypothetical protein
LFSTLKKPTGKPVRLLYDLRIGRTAKNESALSEMLLQAFRFLDLPQEKHGLPG